MLLQYRSICLWEASVESGRIEKWKEENNIDEQEEEEEVACSGGGEANLMMAERSSSTWRAKHVETWPSNGGAPPWINLFLFATEMDDLEGPIKWSTRKWIMFNRHK